LETLLEKYVVFGEELANRANIGADAVIMHLPEIQHLMFEFYALINLCKISLDNLRTFLSPTFTNNHLPKSIRSFIKGKSDCPVYQELICEPILMYLIDIRNCLVHYRSFATSDNTFAVNTKIDFNELIDINPKISEYLFLTRWLANYLYVYLLD